MNGKHLLKAEPLNAILDPQWFVRQVHECVMRVLSDRMAKEQQSADQAALYRSVFMTTAWRGGGQGGGGGGQGAVGPWERVPIVTWLLPRLPIAA